MTIYSAYRRRLRPSRCGRRIGGSAVRYHPDKHYGNPHFEELFKQVAEAYRVLGATRRCAAYDAALLVARQRQAALLRQQRQAGAATWPVGHRYHYATTRPPAAARERAYHTVQQRAQFNRRDRRILLTRLIFLTTAAGAVAMLREVHSDSHADSVYLEGVLALKRGDWASAMTNWSTAIREQPTHGAAYARRADAAAKYQHDYSTALADYNVALRHLRAPADRVRSLTGRADCLMALGRDAAAEEAYAKALVVDGSMRPDAWRAPSCAFSRYANTPARSSTSRRCCALLSLRRPSAYVR